MGAAISSFAVTQQPQTKFDWLLHYEDSLIKYASHASLETFIHNGQRFLALAYQASEAPFEGSPTQHVRVTLSKDGGQTWTRSTVVMWGLGPIWSPVLFYDKRSSRLFLFYSESRKAYSPGGDIKFIAATIANGEVQAWSAPQTIYTHEDNGEVPKVTANRPVVGTDGTLFLPFHTEPFGSYRVFNAKTWCALKDAETVGSTSSISVPPTAVEQGVVTTAGVVVSEDGGKTWSVGTQQIEDAKSWLIQPTIDLTKNGDLLMLFRTNYGKIYSSRSEDQGKTWSAPTATSLSNPNSKFSTLSVDGQLLLVHNPSATDRKTLDLALSIDGGRRWEKLATVDQGTAETDILADPCIKEWSDDTVLIVYTVWGKGLKLATMKLVTVD